MMTKNKQCAISFGLWQTQTFRPEISRSNRRRILYQSQQYNIVGDTLYRRGADSIFRRCITHEEADFE